MTFTTHPRSRPRSFRPLAVLAAAAAAITIAVAAVASSSEPDPSPATVTEPGAVAPIGFEDLATWDGIATVLVTEADTAADPLPDGRSVHWCSGQVTAVQTGDWPLGSEVTFSCAISGSRTGARYSLPASAPAAGTVGSYGLRAMGGRYFAEPVDVAGETLTLPASGEVQTIAGVRALAAG